MAIEVILKKPVEGLGQEADIVRVKPGFARNHLIPKDIATVATAASKKQVEHLKRLRAEREAATLNAAQALAGKLNKVTITFQMETAGEDKVFGSVTSNDIAERLASMGHEVERKKINLPKPIKSTGTTEVTISLPMGVQAKIKVILAAQKAETEDDKPNRKSKS